METGGSIHPIQNKSSRRKGSDGLTPFIKDG